MSDKLQHVNVVFITDYLKHDVIAFAIFQCKLLHFLKEMLPSLQLVQYFSDGSAAQYKNYKNFVNLCHHEYDYGLKAKWNFFTTSHEVSL